MDEFRLKVFLSVVKHKSFTEAARELYISQPAISKHIKELEEKFKTRLFDRTGSKIELTKAGILLNSHAETIINNYNALEFDMNQLIGRYSGELKIGASSTISQYVIPTLLAKFINTYPDIKLSLISGNTTEIENAILRNSIDLGLVEGNYHTNDIKYQDFMNDEIVLVTRAGSKYADLDEINIETLKGIPLILREHGSGTLEVIEKDILAPLCIDILQ